MNQPENSNEQPKSAARVGCSAWLDRLGVYRAKLFAEIERELKLDGHCKSYEGRIELHWPCYFGGDYSIHLACYVLGPSRGYDYYGQSWDECLDKAEADLEVWIKTNRENDAV